MNNSPNVSADERHHEHLRRAVRLALEAERLGNLPIGACLTLENEVVAEAGNAVLVPLYHPGRHAEIEALKLVPPALWPRSREMTLYTTLEPCVMCMGAALLHGVGAVVFGARDTEGGAGVVLPHLPAYYDAASSSISTPGASHVPSWIGPLLPELCDELYRRARERFDILPCGKGGEVSPSSDARND